MVNKNETAENISKAAPTGKVRVFENPENFSFNLEQLYTDGNHYPYLPGKAFKDVADASAFFVRHKRALKTIPADLGNLNDA